MCRMGVFVLRWVEVRVEWVVERVNGEEGREWGAMCLNNGENGGWSCLERV